ncbi:MAG: YjcZ family sporulation protein [Erysipelotrichaceae bacterium]|nr:YjcZ family sporulation protein [Erysipelotrichaceae bacterium]
MYYQNPGYNYGYGCCMPQYNTCCNNNRGSKNGYALILVLFILLVIIGAARW